MKKIGNTRLMTHATAKKITAAGNCSALIPRMTFDLKEDPCDATGSENVMLGSMSSAGGLTILETVNQKWHKEHHGKYAGKNKGQQGFTNKGEAK